MGARLRELRLKIRSARTMQKVTGAMELIATSRIAKARARMQASIPYAAAVTSAISVVCSRAMEDHPLLMKREGTRTLIVLMTSDRGLNGAFSASVLRKGLLLEQDLVKEGKSVDFYLFGKKAVSYFAFRSMKYVKAWTGSERPDFATAKEISKELLDAFLDQDTPASSVYIIYNKFINTIRQEVTSLHLLPFEVVDDTDSAPKIHALYDFEPNVDVVLDSLLVRYVEVCVYNAMLHSAASEHAARQKAMKSASDNAAELVKDYTRLANNARQAEITQQISEIVSGSSS